MEPISYDPNNESLYDDSDDADEIGNAGMHEFEVATYVKEPPDAENVPIDRDIDPKEYTG